MTQLEQSLDAVVRKYNFIACVLANADGRVIVRVGDPRAPAWNDPYNTFFRDAPAILSAFALLKGSQPPQGLAQGTREVLLLQPRPDLILGFVKDDPRSAVEMYQLRRPIVHDVDELFRDVEIPKP